MTRTPDPLETLSDLLARARAHGADAADAVLFAGVSLSAQQRLGKPEHVERAESAEIGLRVFVGGRQAIVSSSDRGAGALDRLAERAVAMARVVPEDPFAGLADAPDGMAGLADRLAALDLADPSEPTADALRDRAAAAEAAALAVPGVTNTEGAEAGFSRHDIALATSTGFAARYVRTGHSVSVTALAGEGTGMERDWDYASAVHAAALEDPAALGRRAGEQAVARLKPRRPKTIAAPVLFHPRVAGGLVGHLAAAINGAAIARSTSFLKDRMGTQLFPPGTFIHDDPHRCRGLRSRPFDGEGMAGRARAVIEDGRLTTWLLDARSARQLGLASTGHASRGTSAPPSPSASNLWLAAGSDTPAALMADVGQGLFVTELIGHGLNMVTGDYSRGAAGFWIEQGRITYPVSEITIAGNLVDMFGHLRAADDLEFRRGTDAPTIRIDGMTIAGA
ncbi:MAG: TldD/PmbA family protein [Alphaproteobacteria bacterium]|nr:TldD/PmbA family protein [Alphaproteobacteria bacterium]